MKKLIVLFSIMLLALTGCSKNNDPVGPGPEIIDPIQGRVTAAINGTPFTADISAIAAEQNVYGKISITPGGSGNFQGELSGIAINVFEPKVGTFAMGGDDDFAVGGVILGDKSYSTYYGGSSGSVTITHYSDDQIIGTFEYIAYIVDTEESVTVTNGQFDLKISRNVY